MALTRPSAKAQTCLATLALGIGYSAMPSPRHLLQSLRRFRDPFVEKTLFLSGDSRPYQPRAMDIQEAPWH